MSSRSAASGTKSTPGRSGRGSSTCSSPARVTRPPSFRVGDGAYSVNWRGHSYAVELVDPLTHMAEVSRGEAGKQGKKIVKAYMPGRVVEVRVAAGDRVEAGQPMVVLEAMKMQNEIQAERAGTVVRVFVTAGEAVEGGDPLVEVD